MRPHLHPDMGPIVLCARVSRHLALRQWRAGDRTPQHASGAAFAASMALPHDYPGMLRFALHSLSVYLDLGMPSSQWLERVLEASHYGSSLRRCFFFDYKENRSPYPRVTNRGVQTSPKATGVRVKKGRINV